MCENPFILQKDGTIRVLIAEPSWYEGQTRTIQHQSIQPNTTYDLLVFNTSNWDKKIEVQTDHEGKVNLEGLCDKALYVLKSEERYTRPFVIYDKSVEIV